MGKRHGTGGKNHQYTKYQFHTVKMVFLFTFRVTPDLASHESADQCGDCTCQNCNYIRFRFAEIQADMLESLEQGDQCNNKSGQEYIERHKTFCVSERIITVQD